MIKVGRDKNGHEVDDVFLFLFNYFNGKDTEVTVRKP